MKSISFNRFPWCCSTEIPRAIDGDRYREAFKSIVLPPDSPLRVVQELISLPVGDGFLTALRNDRSWDSISDSEYVRIKSHRKRHQKHGYSILVPNFTANLTFRAIKSFASCDESCLAAELFRVLPRCVFSYRLSWREFLKALESSSLAMGYPASLISYLNFIDDFAVPGEPNIPFNQVKMPKRQLDTYQELVHEFLSEGSHARSTPDIFQQEWLSRAEKLDEGEADLIRIALFYAFSITPDRRQYGAFRFQVVPGTDKTYLMTFPRAYNLLKNGVLSGKCGGTLETAVQIIRSSSVVTVEHPNAQIPLADARQKRPDYVDLWSPQQLDEALGYPQSFPSVDQIESDAVPDDEISALLIKVLLRNCLVRFDALSSAELSDFGFLDELIEWKIRSSKGKDLDLPFPLSILSSDAECNFVRHAYQHLIHNHRADHSLLRLAHIKTDPILKSVQHYSWLNTMPKPMRTHMSRSTGLSWLVIRAFCIQCPEALEHPALADICSHPWFGDCAVDKLRVLIPSPATDVAEVIRLLVGWETKQQFYQSYLRVNHILLRLYRDLIVPR